MYYQNQIIQMNRAIAGTTALYGLFAREFHISYNELMILYTIDVENGCTQAELVELTQLAKSTVHGILKQYEKKEMIVLRKEPGNKKEKKIYFTEAGRSYTDEILSMIHKREAGAMNKMSDEEREWLVKSNTLFFKYFKEEV